MTQEERQIIEKFTTIRFLFVFKSLKNSPHIWMKGLQGAGLVTRTPDLTPYLWILFKEEGM